MMDNKSRMMGDCHVRFCERLKLKCFCLLDSHRPALCCGWGHGAQVAVCFKGKGRVPTLSQKL